MLQLGAIRHPDPFLTAVCPLGLPVINYSGPGTWGCSRSPPTLAGRQGGGIALPSVPPAVAPGRQDQGASVQPMPPPCPMAGGKDEGVRPCFGRTFQKRCSVSGWQDRIWGLLLTPQHWGGSLLPDGLLGCCCPGCGQQHPHPPGSASLILENRRVAPLEQASSPPELGGRGESPAFAAAKLGNPWVAAGLAPGDFRVPGGARASSVPIGWQQPRAGVQAGEA